MTFGSLFAGIGGFDLGLERAGMECKWQVEIDDYATKVLEKHWPNVKRYRDIRTAGPLSQVDLVCGGFPCQDISLANVAGKGISGARSGLWTEYARIIRAIHPRWVLIENVAALLIRGMDRVLGDLSAIGYDAEWRVLSAYEFGAPQIRERVFIVAYPKQERRGSLPEIFDGEFDKTVLQRAHDQYRRGFGGRIRAFPQSDVFGMSDDVPTWMDRLGCCGNAIVPTIAEHIGHLIIKKVLTKSNPHSKVHK